MTKILVTGAHFTPAIATIEEIKKYPEIKIVYIGRRNTMEGDKSKSVESEVLPKLGVKYIPIITGRLQRSFSAYTIPSLLKIPIGFLHAFYIILKENPDAILSFGGYVAVPVVFAGWLFSIPIIIHEQTLVSGLANSMSALLADKIALSFKQENRFKGENIIITGNPIRQMILNKSRKFFEHKQPLILITGGNQGSHIINKTVEECLEKLINVASIIHVTGNQIQDFEKLERLQNENYKVKKWIGDDYGSILQKVDLVVSRAGANTLTELAYIGKPALVIPIPYLYQHEQIKNAKFFEEQGLVRILLQSNLSGKTLMENIKWMVKNLPELQKRAKKAKKVILPDAAKHLALETYLLARSAAGRAKDKYS